MLTFKIKRGAHVLVANRHSRVDVQSIRAVVLTKDTVGVAVGTE